MVFPNSRAGCSRVPPQSATLTAEYCYPTDPVRLACLIHATSVRSEPESNSQKKKVLNVQKFLGLLVPEFLSDLETSKPRNSETLNLNCSHTNIFLFHVFFKRHVSSSTFKDQLFVAFRANECIVYQKTCDVRKGENQVFSIAF